MAYIRVEDLKQDIDGVMARALSEGPQTIVGRDGNAVILSEEEYRRLTGGSRPSLAQLILRRSIDEGIDLDECIGPRHGPSTRQPPATTP